MRTNGTKYEEVNELPSSALPVSKFASIKGWGASYVYTKHDRHFSPAEGKQPGEYPGFIIRQFKGSNFVIPQ